MEFLVKNKKPYLMIAGTMLPAFLAKKITCAIGMNEPAQQLAFIGGLIFGGMVSAKMLK